MGCHNEDGLDTVASLMQNYVGQAKKIDTRFCPRDFVEAYYRHISALSDEAEAIRSHPHIQSEDEAFADGFLQGLQGDASGWVEEIKSEISEWEERHREAIGDRQDMEGSPGAGRALRRIKAGRQVARQSTAFALTH
jgi:hypothetical protein